MISRRQTSTGPMVMPCNTSWRRGRMQEQGDLVDDGTTLKDDVLAAIFTWLSAADVVRCAATCRRWCRVVAKEAAVLARAMPPHITHARRALLGLFHQDYPGLTAVRKRKRSSSTSAAADGDGRPCFVPMAAAARRFIPGFVSDDAAALLEYSRPVAARNGRVVLELRRERHADGLELCVFNLVTGDAARLPPLTGNHKPGFFACALLTGDDLVLQPPPPSAAAASSSFFRVLIVYNRRSFTALRAYSSYTNRWSAEVARPKIDDGRLRKFGQSVVLRGVAYWPLRRSVLAVRLDGPAEPSEVAMPPDGVRSDWPREHRLLGVTADGELSFIEVGLSIDLEDFGARGKGLPFPCYLSIATTVLRRPATTVGDDGDNYYDMSAGKWERSTDLVIKLKQIRVRRCQDMDAVHLRWFCEKSGVILFTVGEESSSPGAYALNVRTREVEKLADDGGACNSWRNVVGYEMDATTCLASIARY